ncbi:hypothetical protein TNCV_3167351 [Trichonephila clavipes]|uniref:Uncharacterized protein n=1 Tax=Trichonephila clavipes TaxID=2585209 RepID=A0A8X6RE54_TRICX|nr:hypothetical protein TNCV_3167351 [Trichonephila clavipes]
MVSNSKRKRNVLNIKTKREILNRLAKEDVEIVTFVKEVSEPVDVKTDEDEDNTTKVAMVHQMLTRFLC